MNVLLNDALWITSSSDSGIYKRYWKL